MANIKFGTDGWRAIMADQFTFDNVKIVIQAVADFLKAKQYEHQGVIIGYDTRFLAEKFAATAAEVLAANGIKVYLLDKAAPTPVTAYAIKVWKTGGAVMFTASHNPPEYNGVKFIPEYAGPATPVITKELEENIGKVLAGKEIKIMEYHLAVEKELIQIINPRPPYEEQLKSLVDMELLRANPLPVAIDPMFGAGQGYVSNILKGLGWEVTAINDFRDPLFGGSLPEPTAAQLSELIGLVKKLNNGIGLANDGDADRFGVIDSDGTYITPNEVITLLLMHLLKNRKWTGGVVRTVATTHLLDEIAAKYGIEVYETPVGFKYVGELMLQKDILIGGEESGGLSIKGHIPEKDGILANLLMAEVHSFEQKQFGELLQEIKAEFGDYANKRIDLHLPEEKKNSIIKQMRENPPEFIGKHRVSKVNLADGAKFLLEDKSWVLFRPSGTEPLLRIYVEALGKEALEQLIIDVKEFLR
ncbi:MAG: phosphoglucomutase/phosphomannomutase family protein [Carboxydocellales bacterium]